jgi:hypothetical protein
MDNFVYAATVHNVAELQQHVEKACETIGAKDFLTCMTIHKAELCVEVDGQHIEHILHRYIWNILRYAIHTVVLHMF